MRFDFKIVQLSGSVLEQNYVLGQASAILTGSYWVRFLVLAPGVEVSKADRTLVSLTNNQQNLVVQCSRQTIQLTNGYPQGNMHGSYPQGSLLGSYSHGRLLGSYPQGSLLGSYPQGKLFGSYPQGSLFGSYLSTDRKRDLQFEWSKCKYLRDQIRRYYTYMELLFKLRESLSM